MYYLFLAKTLRTKTLKFRPKIVSSFRPHGKWGDVILCLLPISWCANILINSNLLLKLLEWQAESSLFTIRIRGKQWYWVYKFDFKHFTDVISTPKNIGRNKWVFNFFGELKTSDNYLHIIQMRSQNKWIKQYWSKNIGKFEQEDKTNFNLVQETLPVVFNKSAGKDIQYELFSRKFLKNFWNIELSFLHTENSFNKKPVTYRTTTQLNYGLVQNLINGSGQEEFNNVLKNNINSFNKLNKFFNKIFSLKTNNWLKKNQYNYLTHTIHEESNREIKNTLGKAPALTLVKLPVDKLNALFDTNQYMFKLRFNDKNSTLTNKNIVKTPYFAFKQQRYKSRKLIPMTTRKFTDINNNTDLEQSVKNNFTLSNQYSIETDVKSPEKYYRMFRKNRTRDEKMPVLVSKRLLRVKKTLVLPTHINITAVTNSYDVVHSWFIPGLGLKMDCVPGRSTHHTFYVDNAGFYYGQCAEICGRYHHHMPIRVCALPFEHFLLWWHTFGLPKLMYPGKKHKIMKMYSFRKFVW